MPASARSFSNTPFNHDAWFSLFMWPGFDGDLKGDLDGDFAGLGSLSPNRKAFNLVRDFEEMGYESRCLDIAAVKYKFQAGLPSTMVACRDGSLIASYTARLAINIPIRRHN